MSGFSDEIELISKRQYEAQLQQIFRLLLENKSQEEIARELHISTRTIARYSQRIEKRYGEAQRQKTDNTLFTECQLFKNRMLTLYKALESQVTSDNISGTEKARCAEIAVSIAIDALRLETEGIKAVKQGLIAIGEAAATITPTVTKSSYTSQPSRIHIREKKEGDEI